MDDERIFLARHGQTFHNAAAGESYIDADGSARPAGSRHGGSARFSPHATSARW
jgi:broad specificity phosphatase PhoE